jgi:hypothetical protein
MVVNVFFAALQRFRFAHVACLQVVAHEVGVDSLRTPPFHARNFVCTQAPIDKSFHLFKDPLSVRFLWSAHFHGYSIVGTMKAKKDYVVNIKKTRPAVGRVEAVNFRQTSGLAR